MIQINQPVLNTMIVTIFDIYVVNEIFNLILKASLL